jgi:hypothetical protein
MSVIQKGNNCVVALLRLFVTDVLFIYVPYDIPYVLVYIASVAMI